MCPFAVTERGKLRVVCSSSGTCGPAKSNVESDTEARRGSSGWDRVCVVEYWLPSDEAVPYTSENERELEGRGDLSSDASGFSSICDRGGGLTWPEEVVLGEVVQLPATE